MENKSIENAHNQSSDSLQVAQNDLSVSQCKEYKRGGTAGIEGSLYQIKVLALILLRATKKGCNFSLATEMEAADKFDDLVYSYLCEERWESILLQVKHRQDDTKKITLEELLTETDGDYSLVKYYYSYQKIKSKSIFGTVREVVIYTNAGLHEDTKKFARSFTREENHILSLYEDTLNNTYFKIEDTIIGELKPKLEMWRIKVLATKLIDQILEGEPIRIQKGSIFEEYKSVLFTEVLQVNSNKTIQFRNHFLEEQDLRCGTKKFREYLNCSLKYNMYKFRDKIQIKLQEMLSISQNEKLKNSKRNKLKENQTELKKHFETYETMKQEYNLKDLSIYLRNIELKVSNLGEVHQESGLEWPQETVSESNIKDFFQHLTLMVNQSNEERLGMLIQKEIGINSEINALATEYRTSLLFNKILDWFKLKTGKNKDHGMFLTHEDGKDILFEIKSKHNALVILDKGMKYWEKIRYSDIKFQSGIVDELKDFISSNRKLFYIVTDNNALAVIQLYQALFADQYEREYLYMDSYTLQRSKPQDGILRFFYASGFCGLIVNCTPFTDETEQNVDQLLLELCKCVEGTDKIIILITQRHDLFASRLANTKYARTEIKHSLADITNESKCVLVSREVKFQDRKVALNKLMLESDMATLVDADTILKLVENEEILIGASPPLLSDSEAAYAPVYEEIPRSKLAEAVVRDSKNSTLYLITGSEQSSGLENELTDLLNIKSDYRNTFKTHIRLFHEQETGDANIIILSNRDSEENNECFKSVCKANPRKFVYWIHVNSQSCVLQQLYNPNFYVKRKLCFPNKSIHIENFKLLMEKQEISDHYIFCSVNDKKELFEILEITEQNQSLADKNMKNFHFSEDNTDDIFHELIHLEEPVHQFAVNNETGKKLIVWQQSHGSIEGLRKHLDTNTCAMDTYEESQIRDMIKTKVVILADEPGMGKSTILSSISEQLLSTMWVIRINFKDCHNALAMLPSDEKQSSFNTHTVVSFLSKIPSLGINSDLTRNFLLHCLLTRADSHARPVLLLLDGYDEVSDEDQKKIMALLLFLKLKTWTTIWITTRPYCKNKLENTLSAFAIQLEGFKEYQQQEFLTSFWNNRFYLVSNETFQSVKDKLRSYTNSLLQKCSHLFTESKVPFMGIPLQLHMLSLGYQEDVLRMLKYNAEIKIQNLNLLNIYNLFIKEKYNIYFRKTIHSNCLPDFFRSSIEKTLDKSHEYFAFRTLFYSEEEAIHYMFPSEDIAHFQQYEDHIKAVGIIQSLDPHGHVYFMHQTFSEYFVATLFVRFIMDKKRHLLKYDIMKRFLMIELFNNRNAVIFNFMNQILSRDSPTHWKVLNGDLSCLNFIDGGDLDLKDGLGRTALHLAVQTDQGQIVEGLLQMGCDALKTDEFGKTPLHYACHFGRQHIVEYLLEYHTDIDIKNNIFTSPLYKHMFAGSSLFNNPEYAHSKLVALVNMADHGDKPALYYAVQNHHYHVCHHLISNGADLTFLTDENKSDFLKNFNYFPFVEYILESFMLVLLCSNTKVVGEALKDDRRYLFLFYNSGHTKVLDIFLNSYQGDIREVWGTFDYFWDDSDNLLMVEYLFSKGLLRNQEIYDKILSNAFNKGHLETVKYLIEIKYQNRTIDNYLEYLDYNMYIASAYGHRNLLEYFLLNHVLKDKEAHDMVLNNAVKRGHYKTVQYLCENGANVHITINEQSLLGVALSRQNIKLVKYLNSRGVQLRENDLTPESLQLLIYDNHNAKTLTKPIKKDEQKIPFFYRDFFNNNLKVQWLHPQYKNEFGDTLLHLAVNSLDLGTVCFLIECGADVNVKNKAGLTPLHLVFCHSLKIDPIKSGLGLIAHYLFLEGATYDVENILLMYRILPKQNIKIFQQIKNLFYSRNFIIDLKEVCFENPEFDRLSSIKYPYCPVPRLLIINAVDSKQRTIFHKLAMNDDWESIEYLIKKYINDTTALNILKRINAVDIEGNTPLHMAVERGYIDTAFLLLQHGASYNSRNKQGFTPGELASMELFEVINTLYKLVKNRVTDIKEYLKRSLYISCRDKEGKTLLHRAALYGNSEVVETLLHCGAEVDAWDSDRLTPLDYAVQSQQPHIIDTLFRHGATLTAFIRQQGTTRQLSHITGSLPTVLWMFENIRKNKPDQIILQLQQIKMRNAHYMAAVVNACDEKGSTLLHLAAKMNHPQIILYLLENGASYETLCTGNFKIDYLLKFCEKQFNGNFSVEKIEQFGLLQVLLNIRDGEGQSILHRSKHYYISQYLVHKGCDVNLKDKNGQSPLHEVARRGRLQCTALLLRWGADVRAVSHCGETVLHSAATSGNPLLCSYLLTHGADIHAKDYHGNSALDYLINSVNKLKKNHIDIVKIFLEHDIDVSTVVEAVRKGHLDLVKLLVQRGTTITTLVNSRNLLHEAILSARIDITKWLLEQGTDVGATDGDGRSVLHQVLCSQEWDIFEWLLKHGARIYFFVFEDFTVLRVMCSENDAAIIRWLILNENEACTVDIHTEKHLEDTVSLGHDSFVKWLLQHKCQVSVNREDSCVAHWTFCSNSLDISDFLKQQFCYSYEVNIPFVNDFDETNEVNAIQLLIGHSSKPYDPFCGGIFLSHCRLNTKMKEELINKYLKTSLKLNDSDIKLQLMKLLTTKYNCDITIADKAGDTLLHLAASCGYLKIAQWLVKQGVSVSCSNINGSSPLHEAASAGHLDVVAWLVKRGALLDARSRDGKTALLEATDNGHWHLVHWLVEHGADVGAVTRDGRSVLHSVLTSDKDVASWLTEYCTQNNSVTVNTCKIPLNRKAPWLLWVLKYLIYCDLPMDELNIQKCLGSIGQFEMYRSWQGELYLKGNIILNAGCTILQFAKAEQPDIVQWLTNRAGPDIITFNDYSVSVVNISIELLDLLKWLVVRGANIKSQVRGRTLLHEAVVAGHLETIEWLIAEGLDVNAEAEDEGTPLFSAVAAGNMEAIQCLVQRGAHIAVITRNGRTLLHQAVSAGHLNILEWLMQNHLNVNVETAEGVTPLQEAVGVGNMNIIQYLVDREANILVKNKKGETLLHDAAYYGYLDVIQWLKVKGLNVNEVTKNGKTPLHYAIVNGDIETMEYLMALGADVGFRNRRGETLLHIAAIAGHLDVVEWLVEKGLDVNAVTEKKQRVVHAGSGAGKVQVVEWLTRHGARLDCSTTTGRTVLHEAACHGHSQMTSWLLKQSCLDVNATTKEGKTALDFANMRRHEDIAQILLQHGAKTLQDMDPSLVASAGT